jgi:hypothetical protein
MVHDVTLSVATKLILSKVVTFQVWTGEVKLGKLPISKGTSSGYHQETA